MSGLLALLWLLLRSGAKPSRLAYPCQQAALTTAAAAFGVPFIAMVVAARGRLPALLRTGRGVALAAGACVVTVVVLTIAAPDTSYRGTFVQPPPAYEADVFLVNDAGGATTTRFSGVDDLITCMGANGTKFHRSTTDGVTFGPDGLIDRDDVVVIKINAQWAQRGGTNTDVLRGVIRRIVEHPDGFVGEVVVVDNGQGSGYLNRPDNNAEDITQSVQDVVSGFVGEGWRVSGMLWDTFRAVSVGEYAAGDMSSGYIVSATIDPETSVRVSYPKFETANGTHVSYKYGIWSPVSSSYDPAKLVVINMPVLKTHFIYGVTGAVKNHMGLITQSLGTDSHSGVARGGLGSVLAEARVPDLTIVDAIWVLARPGLGPSASYANATRRDQLVASTDPVALDIWAVKNILIPEVVANGYSYNDYRDDQDPDDPASTFRNYLDRSMNEMLLAGIDTTNDLAAVNLHVFVAGVVVPAVSEWGLVVMFAGTLIVATMLLRTRHTGCPA